MPDVIRAMIGARRHGVGATLPMVAEDAGWVYGTGGSIRDQSPIGLHVRSR
jgi:hypothetical protein